MIKRFLIFSSLLASASIAFRSGAFAERPSELLQLRVEPASFSPNGDDSQDQTFFYPVLQSPADVTRWRLDILGKGKNKKRLAGGELPPLIQWDGTDSKNNPLPEGVYAVALSIWGRGLKASAQSQVQIDRTPPVATLSVSSPVFQESVDGVGAIVFSPGVDDASGVSRWQLKILDMEGHTAQLFWSTESLHDVTWDGHDQTTERLAAPGTYRCAFQAWDQAGNEGLPTSLDVVSIVTPKQMLEGALKNIKVYETDLGLLVQLRSAALFNETASAVQITERGKVLLREAAILIKTYSDVSVSLNGYAVKPRRAIGRDHSSLYAWSVYSFLVKEGGVKPSRLMVRGRGQTQLPERNSVDVPRLTSGIEIILEGNREW